MTPFIRLFLLLLCFASTSLASAQGHTRGEKGELCCRVLSGAPCNSERGTNAICPACRKEGAAKREAEAAKKKREEEAQKATAARQKAENEAYQKAAAEKLRKEKEAQKRTTVTYGLPSVSASSSTSSVSTSGNLPTSSSGGSSSNSSSTGTTSSTTPTLSQADYEAIRRSQRTHTEVMNDLVSETTTSLMSLAADLRAARIARQEREQRIYESRLRQQAREAQERRSAQQSVDLYLPKAEKGDTYAMEVVAANYRMGLKDEAKALYWEEKAANAGSVTACYSMITRLEKQDKHGISGPTSESLKWIPKLIEVGEYRFAILQIQISYGLRGSKFYDSHRALDLYKQIAQKGSADAMFVLGQLLTGGNTYSLKGKRNYNVKEGLAWLQLCSGMGDSYHSVKAVEELATIYETGRLVDKDPAKAAEYTAAARQLRQQLGYAFYLYAVLKSRSTNKIVTTEIATCYGGSGSKDGVVDREVVRTAKDQFREYIRKQYAKHFPKGETYDIEIDYTAPSATGDYNNTSNLRAYLVGAHASNGREVILDSNSFVFDERL